MSEAAFGLVSPAHLEGNPHLQELVRHGDCPAAAGCLGTLHYRRESCPLASWKGWMASGRKEMSKEDGLKQEWMTSYEEDERYQVKKIFFFNT